MIPILVTGGAGYIGAHTCKALKDAGFLPITYDNFSTGHRYAVQWGPCVEGDLRDSKTLEETLQKYKPKGVLHFAASALVIESMHNPGLYYDNNVGGSLSLLEAMRKHEIPYLVFSSTCATYGNPQFSPITEEHPQLPINPYGRSKLMVEQIIEDFGRTYGLCSVNLRYFNAAGADFSGSVGENHTPETHIIPLIMQVAQKIRKEITIYGTQFPTPDGTAVRDYIHVVDLARAHVQALQWLFAHKKKRSINLGTGKGFSILEIVKAVEEFTKEKIPVRFESERAGEPSHLVADNTKARNVLGWAPEYSSLPMLIESAWKWHTRITSSSENKMDTLNFHK